MCIRDRCVCVCVCACVEEQGGDSLPEGQGQATEISCALISVTKGGLQNPLAQLSQRKEAEISHAVLVLPLQNDTR